MISLHLIEKAGGSAINSKAEMRDHWRATIASIKSVL